MSSLVPVIQTLTFTALLLIFSAWCRNSWRQTEVKDKIAADSLEQDMPTVMPPTGIVIHKDDVRSALHILKRAFDDKLFPRKLKDKIVYSFQNEDNFVFEVLERDENNLGVAEIAHLMYNREYFWKKLYGDIAIEDELSEYAQKRINEIDEQLKNVLVTSYCISKFSENEYIISIHKRPDGSTMQEIKTGSEKWPLYTVTLKELENNRIDFYGGMFEWWAYPTVWVYNEASMYPSIHPNRHDIWIVKTILTAFANTYTSTELAL